MLSTQSGGRRRKGTIFKAVLFVFSIHLCVWQSMALLEMAEPPPAHGKWRMNSLVWFALENSFCFTYWAVFISAHHFSHFHSSNSLPHPIVWEQVSGWGGLSCHLGLNHNKMQIKPGITLWLRAAVGTEPWGSTVTPALWLKWHWGTKGTT